MSDGKITQSLVNLENALSRLREALQEPHHNALIIDGTIQRFEFVLELYWKTLKRLLANEGIEANTPKETLKKPMPQNGLIMKPRGYRCSMIARLHHIFMMKKPRNVFIKTFRFIFLN